MTATTTAAPYARTIKHRTAADGHMLVTALVFDPAAPYMVTHQITDLTTGRTWPSAMPRPRLVDALELDPSADHSVPAAEDVELRAYPAPSGRWIRLVVRPHRADRQSDRAPRALVAELLAASFALVEMDRAAEMAAWQAVTPRWPWSTHNPGCSRDCPCGGRNAPARA